MIKLSCSVSIKEGLHARPAAHLCKIASEFKSKITLSKDGQDFEAKSILMVMSMGAEYGDTITVIAEGEDEKQAADSIVKILSGEN